MKIKLDKELIDTLRTMARMIVNRWGYPACQPDELVNEAILYYLKNKKRLRNHPNLPAYLIMKMKSLYIDMIRKSKKLLQITNQLTLENERILKDMIQADHDLDQHDDFLAVRLYLEGTAKQICREILVLWIKGFTTNDMAKIIGIAKGTVLSRLYNCRKELVEFISTE